MTTQNSHNDYDLTIMLAEMPAPIDPTGLMVVNHVELKHPQLGSYPSSQYNDYPELGSC
jgi:hypothetical protein